MEKIVLSDGREFNVDSFAIASSGHMFIRVKMPLAQAAVAFATGTDRIEYHPEDGDAVALTGWTQLSYIVNEEDCVRVALERPMDIQELTNG